jgi:hypothetical protein
MPQNPLGATIATKSGKFVAPMSDATGSNNLSIQGGGLSATLNVTQATVVATGARRLRKIAIVLGGSTAGIQINDAATTTAATTTGSTQSNVIWFANTTAVAAIVNAGGIVNFDWPCANGIVVGQNTFPTGGQIAVSYD